MSGWSSPTNGGYYSYPRPSQWPHTRYNDRGCRGPSYGGDRSARPFERSREQWYFAPYYSKHYSNFKGGGDFAQPRWRNPRDGRLRGLGLDIPAGRDQYGSAFGASRNPMRFREPAPWAPDRTEYLYGRAQFGERDPSGHKFSPFMRHPGYD